MAEPNEEIQQKFILYQLLQQRAEELKQQIEMLQQKNMEMETTKFALGEISKVKEGNDILVPLGSGCYTHGKVGNSGKILVDLGAGILTNKDPESAKQVVEEKREEIEKLLLNLHQEFQEAASKMQELLPELQKASEDKG